MFQIGVTMGEGCVTLEDVLFCVRHGVTEFRINLANPWGRRYAVAISNVLREMRTENSDLGILWDVPFPNKKLRYYTYMGKRYDVKRGDRLLVIPSHQPHLHHSEISIPTSLFDSIEIGDRLVVGDGETMLVAEALVCNGIACYATDNWFISDGKSLTVDGRENVLRSDPNDLPLRLADIDGFPPRFACSFIRDRQDLSLCRERLPPSSKLMAKVETVDGVRNAREIVRNADSLMIARGDLALNVGFARMGRAQSYLIDECNVAGRAVFVATEILSSLSFRSTPLRAEVSDLFSLCRTIRRGGLILTKESSMPGMLRKSLPLIAEIVLDARQDTDLFNTNRTRQDALATAR